MKSNNCASFAGLSLLTGLLAATMLAQSPSALTYSTTWIGNSYNGNKWVQNFIDEMTVSSDGTCYTKSGWDESGRSHGEYKNGDVIGNEDHGINSRSAENNGVTWTVTGGYRPWPGSSEGEFTGTAVTSSDGRSIPDPGNPRAVAFDNTGKLMVADNGPRQQVFFFDVSSGTPKLVKTLGQKGGVMRAGIPGEVKPDKFNDITGVGCDAQGNVYVGMNGFYQGTAIRCFTSEGVFKWEVHGLFFVDASDPDPGTDGEYIYSAQEIFKMDYSKKEGKEYTWIATTLDPFKYPNDQRCAGGSGKICAPTIRIIQGKRFMFLNGMFTGGYSVYRFEEPPSMIAVPAGSIGSEWADDIDEKGDVWWAEEDCGGIWHHKFLEIDSQGVPLWDKGTKSDCPTEFKNVCRMKYFAKTDEMYISGFTSDHPNTAPSAFSWGQWGTVLYRFDNWSKPGRTIRYSIIPPYKPTEWVGIVPKCMCITGNKIFIAQGPTAELFIYNREDGAFIETIKPGPEVDSWSGWIDIPYGINAFLRKNGEYIITAEEDGKCKNIVYRLKTTDAGPDWRAADCAAPDLQPPTMALTDKKECAARQKPYRFSVTANTITLRMNSSTVVRAELLTLGGRTVCRTTSTGAEALTLTPKRQYAAGTYLLSIKTQTDAFYETLMLVRNGE